MHRWIATAAVAAVVLTNCVSAADSPQVTQMKAQVKELKAQRDAVVKALHAQYDAVINHTKQSEAQLAAAKKTLGQQEAVLGATNTSAEGKAAAANMETLRQAMRGEIKVDAAVINKLRAQRNGHIAAVKTAYDTQIKQIEANIKAAGTPAKR